MKITRKSIISGIESSREIDVNQEQITRWQEGTPIQNAMPHLSASDREFIKSGITSEEWERAFPEEQEQEPDCHFYTFKPSGKWYAEGKGFFPSSGKEGYWEIDRQKILDANGGKMPGLSSTGDGFTVVVIPMERCSDRFAWPRILKFVPDLREV